MMTKYTSELRNAYAGKKGAIEQRLSDFSSFSKAGGEELFEELAFCILTPQSKARSCDLAIKELKESRLLMNGSAKQIAHFLSKRTRFHNNKAKYIVGARERFGGNGFESLREMTFSGSEREARKKLATEVKGIGMKEASHYLRNVGRGETIAILDRHILKNLINYGAIAGAAKGMTCRKYLEIEKKMERFSRKTRIPLSHMDLLFWAKEAGGIFK